MAALTMQAIIEKKKRGEKIAVLTAYDYPMGKLLDQCGIDMVLVGDSLANVVLGLESTKDVGMPEMLHHCKAVRRGVERALVVADMPYGSYTVLEDALANAKKFTQEAGADAVKLEWFDQCPQITSALVNAGIPVMGHVGLTPQTADQLGGFKVQGKDASSARAIIEQAKALEKNGCFSLVLECVPDKLAEFITQQITIPTIGIGAGAFCDGQVLVTHDLIGLFDRFQPKFAKRYVQTGDLIRQGVAGFIKEVQSGVFPDQAHSFHMRQDEFDKISS